MEIEDDNPNTSDFEIYTLGVSRLDENGIVEKESFRIFDLAKLQDAFAEGFEIAAEIREYSEDESEREFFDLILQLVSLHHFTDGVDRRRSRIIDFNQARRYESIRELMRTSGATEKDECRRILKVKDSFSASASQLFDAARFERPTIKLPGDLEAYEQFRREFLDEMTEVRKNILQSADETVRAEMRRLLNDSSSSEEDKEKAKRVLSSQDVFEEFPQLYDTWMKIESDLIRNAIKIEEQRASLFHETVTDVETLFGKLEEKCNELSLGLEDLDATIDLHLEIEEAIACITGIVQIAEEHDELLEPEIKLLMNEAIQSKSPFQLWDILLWAHQHLVNRNEYVRLLSREAEWAFHFLLEIAFEERYLRIRTQLTKPERRLFRFMYGLSNTNRLGIPVLSEIGRSFVLGLDKSHTELFLRVIAFKATTQETNELETRWKSFLQLYPFWCELMRSDDREARRKQPLPTIPPDVADSLSSVKNRVSPSIRLPPSLIDAEEVSVQELAQRYCTETQSRHVEMAFVKRKSHADIANLVGISQQAVSKSINSAIRRIRKGMLRDGLVERTTYSGKEFQSDDN